MKKTPEHSDSPTSAVNRRNFFKILTSVAVASVAATPTLRALRTAFAQHEQGNVTHAAPSHTETIHDNPVDIQSAEAVLAAFAYFVGFEGIIQGKSLGFTSAAIMSSLALGRTALLAAEQDPELTIRAHEEREAIIEGIRNTGILVALADAATHEQTGVRADAERIFQESSDSVLNSSILGEDRPDLAADRDEWLAYEKKLNQTIVSFVAEIMGFSGVMAPVTTTFVSSAVSNQMKEKIARAIFEQSIARAICREKRNKPATIHMDAIYQEAQARTETAINGSLGFTNLLVATAANAQGSLILGGAPYIFTVGDNVADPDQFATNTAIGAMNALVAPMVLSMIWLAGVDIVTEGISPKQFIARYLDTGRSILTAVLRKRSVSFTGGSSYTKGIVDALSGSDEDKEKKLKAVVEHIPTAEIQFDFIQHLLAKTSASKDWLENLVTDSINFFKQQKPTDPQKDIWQAFASGDSKTLATMIGQQNKLAERRDIGSLVEVFKAISQQDELAAHQKTVFGKAVHVDQNAYERGKKSAAAIQASIANLNEELDQNTLSNEIDKVLSAQGIGRDTIKQALADYTRIASKEDAVPNEDVVHQDVLSHSAKEALWALLTQVPAVSSAVRMAEYVIPAAAGITPGEKPTPEQLKTVCTIVIALITSLSAIADNVAAFLFGKSVLLKFFEQALGKPYMDTHPDLARKLIAACITVAQNAGAITKLGSPTNFAQQKMLIQINPSNPQGMAIDRVDLPIAETVKNGHALIWNGLVGALARYQLHGLIDEASHDRETNNA